MSKSINQHVKDFHEHAKSKGWWDSKAVLIQFKDAEAAKKFMREEVEGSTPQQLEEHGVVSIKFHHRSPLEIVALITSELSEAVEHVRNGSPEVFQVQVSGPLLEQTEVKVPYGDPRWRDDVKPDGEAIEFIDSLIRHFDYAGFRGWNLEQLLELKHRYNETRAYRHGGKAY